MVVSVVENVPGNPYDWMLSVPDKAPLVTSWPVTVSNVPILNEALSRFKKDIECGNGYVKSEIGVLLISKYDMVEGNKNGKLESGVFENDAVNKLTGKE